MYAPVPKHLRWSVHKLMMTKFPRHLEYLKKVIPGKLPIAKETVYRRTERFMSQTMKILATYYPIPQAGRGRAAVLNLQQHGITGERRNALLEWVEGSEMFNNLEDMLPDTIVPAIVLTM
ncbi:hypothetical protein SARC_01932 [Sphaeroforma arctica JP610]|uniref:Uncharacterized protein n=1 Tax=Sphaeroforma arctica JP610 TaxID=667725 RepID=A0A0L0GAG0_9EUKA|nr:hypothetical protein SARC_01932 [Sphaeroforma arctica JP610]KNC85894.1 hypothetical protein SARC_01932 [Sphaeroforma arctica JP610]|eukprot:XP_014159796.1 hypothetical protein SARC_01932 [Sphaeroforma arctica JP610]